uniref:Uncharacterized protein n=1 Tax=Rhizophora mucronata TaxID=61149 RepID=A0A2P2LW74_RHIMU
MIGVPDLCIEHHFYDFLSKGLDHFFFTFPFHSALVKKRKLRFSLGYRALYWDAVAKLVQSGGILVSINPVKQNC